MADNDWKKRLGVVYSTNPDFKYITEEAAEPDTPAPQRQRLIVSIDRRQRAGKQVTLIKGFTGRSEDLEALAAEARRQIDEKNYAASLESEGITDIMKFGYAFFSKKSAICR